jgi:hypothetical protein
MIALRTGIESRRCRLFKIGEKPVWGSLGYQGTCRPYVPTARSRPAAVGSVFAMQEQERAMGKKAWSRKPLVAALARESPITRKAAFAPAEDVSKRDRGQLD